MIALEKENISNILVDKTEYSEMEKLRIALKTKAVSSAKGNAVALAAPLNQKVGGCL